MFHLRRSLWAMLFFLAGFAGLVTFISLYYLLPALAAVNDATSSQKKALSAYSALLLSIILFILLVGLLYVMRSRRTVSEARKPTQYIDAWAESAKRVQVEPEDEP